jgi:hypothetical protein
LQMVAAQVAWEAASSSGNRGWSRPKEQRGSPPLRAGRGLRHNQRMGRKLLVSRLGAGSVTIAFCAVLPGCNLAIHPNNCTGQPSSRGMSSVECPADADARADTARDTTSAPAGDGASADAREGDDGPSGDAAGPRP